MNKQGCKDCPDSLWVDDPVRSGYKCLRTKEGEMTCRHSDDLEARTTKGETNIITLELQGNDELVALLDGLYGEVSATYATMRNAPVAHKERKERYVDMCMDLIDRLEAMRNEQD